MELSNARCLVTGATSGIGRATALGLARAGALVTATGRDEAALREVAGRTSGPFIRTDLSDPNEVARLAERAGPIDVLVNNAGEGWSGAFAEMPPDRIAELIQTNLAATVALTRALLPGMLERRNGHIVNVASIAGHVGVRDEAVYSATKAALIAFSEALLYELRGLGVGLTVVSPGVVRTAFFARRGRPYSRRWPRPIDAERVARAIVHAIRTGRAQVFVPWWLAVPVWVRGAAPGVYRRFGGQSG